MDWFPRSLSGQDFLGDYTHYRNPGGGRIGGVWGRGQGDSTAFGGLRAALGGMTFAYFVCVLSIWADYTNKFIPFCTPSAWSAFGKRLFVFDDIFRYRGVRKVE